MAAPYVPQSRPERLIAAGRVVLAAASLFAVWLDPSEPVRHAALAYLLLVLYLGYAAIVAVVLPRLGDAALVRQRLATHVVDLAFFSLFVYFTAGPGSPFTVYFVFSLVCASLRWGWRGTMATAAAALAAFAGLALYFALVMRDPAVELQACIIRGVYMLVIAVLLGYLGAHEQRTRREMGLLASWPPQGEGEPRALVRELLQHAAATLQAPQALLAWRDADDHGLHVASWHEGAFAYDRLEPAPEGPLTHPDLVRSSFLCPRGAGFEVALVRRGPEAEGDWRARPLHPALVERCAAGSLLCLPASGETFDGRLCVAGKRDATSDDLVLGEVVAGVLAARLDQAALMARLEARAATEERIRLARDLHDGVLQSLTGIALRLAAVRRLLEAEPAAAAERLEQLQRLIALEQRDLRFYIQELKPSSRAGGAPATLGSRLEELAQRVAREWDLTVDLHAADAVEGVADGMVQEVYLIAREAVVNAVRHGGASRVVIRVDQPADGLALSVADNGTGFPFHGRYDGEALRALGAGPRSLLERVSALGGELLLESAAEGARVDVRLPAGAAR
jgi:signal transduction histidine kinase